MNRSLSHLAIAALALGLMAPMAPARTYRTTTTTRTVTRYNTRARNARYSRTRNARNMRYNRVRGMRHVERYTVRYGAQGAWGQIVRKPTVTNRNIRVLFDTGENPILEIPMNAQVTRDGMPVSVHDLHNGDRVQVWAHRGKQGEAMQAWRIRAFNR